MMRGGRGAQPGILQPIVARHAPEPFAPILAAVTRAASVRFALSFGGASRPQVSNALSLRVNGGKRYSGGSPVGRAASDMAHRSDAPRRNSTGCKPATDADCAGDLRGPESVQDAAGASEPQAACLSENRVWPLPSSSRMSYSSKVVLAPESARGIAVIGGITLAPSGHHPVRAERLVPAMP